MNKRNQISKYANMVRDELHEEYMNIPSHVVDVWYFRDILSEVIGKVERIELMARIRWYHKLIRKWKYRG